MRDAFQSTAIVSVFSKAHFNKYQYIVIGHDNVNLTQATVEVPVDQFQTAGFQVIATGIFGIDSLF